MNTKLLALAIILGILLFGSLGLSSTGSRAVLMAGDADGDGVPDVIDQCPGENASFFDRDGDGCLDAVLGARHTEYWASEDMPFTYYINASGAPGIGDGSDFAAIQSAMSAWAAIPGVDFSVSYAGTTAQENAAALDRINLVTFVDDEYQFGAAVIAVGISTSFTVDSLYEGKQYRPGQIVDADMIFNPLKAFRTPTAGAQGTDIQSVATHEAAHLFGIAHSPVRTSTMFYVLVPGTGAASLETEDGLVFLKAYPDSETLADATRLSGRVLDGTTNEPVPGAIVYAIDAAGDTVAADYTLPDGGYTFLGLESGSYYVAIHPLDGTSAIGGLKPYYINDLVDTTAVTVFPAEYWNANESNADPAGAMDAVVVGPAAPATGIDIVTNIDSTPPEVVAMTPAASADSVSVDAVVRITFSEPIDDATISGNFKLRDVESNLLIGGSATILKDDSVIAFTPSQGFDFEKEYRLVLETGLADKYGNGLASQFVSSFLTETAPPLAITSLSPNKGVAGSIVVVNGFGFDPLPENNQVWFGSSQAGILSAFRNRLVVMAPHDAQTGLVTVTTGELVSNGLTFTVLSDIEVARGFQTGVAELDATPRAIVTLPDGGWAYVATSAGISAVVVDPGLEGYLTVTTIDVAGGIDGLEVTPDGKRLYAVSRTNAKLYTIDTDRSHAILFNTIVAEHPVDGEPLGVVVDPGGGRAYVPTGTSMIEVWDVRDGSATFEQPVGLIDAAGRSLRGAMAIDPVEGNLFILSGAGKALVYDLGPDTLLASIDVLLDPRDIIVDPEGRRAYVSDETGNCTVVSVTGLFKVQDINTGGSLRGMTITPAGQFLYAANRLLGLIDVIDLRESSATFRSVAATIMLESNPVDIARSADGFYAFSILENSRQMVVTTIGLGPRIKSLSRRAGPVGTKIVIAGDGFGTDPAKVRVQFGGVQGPAYRVYPSFITGTSLTVTVPSWAANGPVWLETTEFEYPDPTWRISNALYFQVLDTEIPQGALRFAAGAAPPGGWVISDALAFSPTGDILVVGGDNGEIGVFDTDPASATFNQFIGTSRAVTGDVQEIVISPDGERAFMPSLSDTAIRIVNVNRHSALFGKTTGIVHLPTAHPEIRRMAISLDGERLFAAPWGSDSLFMIDIVPGSTTENHVIAWVAGMRPLDIAAHPDGRYLYVADVSSRSVKVVDFSLPGPTFMDVVGQLTLPPTPYDNAPISLSFTPDGTRCEILAAEIDSRQRRYVVSLDCADPVNPVFMSQIDLDNSTTIRGWETIDVSPRGDRAIAAIGQGGYYAIDLAAEPDTIHSIAFDMSLLSPVDMDFSPDGTRFYTTAEYPDSIYIYDFNSAGMLQMVSGDEQSGVVGQPLAAPLRVRVEAFGAGPPVGIPGVALTYRVTAGGGHFTESGLQTQVVATDLDGYAELEWTLGDSLCLQCQFVEVSAPGVAYSPVTFVADAYESPDNLPLVLVQLLPLNGTTNASVTTGVQGTFSRAVDPASISDVSFYVRDAVTLEKVPALAGFADGDRRVTLFPSASLDYGREYQVMLTEGVRDTDGGSLVNIGSSIFATGPRPPAMLASIAPPSATVGATLVLSGQGFDPNEANDTVLFTGAAASPIDAGVDYVTVVVPANAIAGEVRVVCGPDTSNARFFTVLVPSQAPIDEVVATVNTGTSTKSVAVTPDGAIAYTVSTDGDVVVPIDVEGQASYPSISVGDQPTAIAIHPEGTYAYVANFGSGTVSVIVVDPDSAGFNTVVQTISVGTNPIDVAVAPDGDRVYVANAGSASLSVIDGDEASATHHQVVTTVQTGSSAKSVVVTPDGARVYVGTDNGYVVVDPGANTVVTSVDTGSSTKSLAITPDGALLVLLTTNGSILIVDVQPGSPTENEVVATVAAGTSTKSVTVTPDGALLYIFFEDGSDPAVYSLSVLEGAGVIEPGAIPPPTRVVLAFVHTISAGADPSAIAFDPSGTGMAVICNAGDGTVTILNASSVPLGPLSAWIEVTPHTLNLQSHGRWITGRIELPAAYWPEEIALSSVLLQGAIPADPSSWEIEDCDDDGIREFVVKFDRAAFQAILPEGEYVPVTIAGDVRNRSFEGMDTIRTIRPHVTHPSGGVLTLGTFTTVAWTSPDGYPVDSVTVAWTKDDGATWEVLAHGMPDARVLPWRVPETPADRCRVLVMLFSKGEILGTGISQETFMISVPVAVTVGSFAPRMAGESAAIAWSTRLESGVDAFNVLRSDAENGVYARVNDRPIPATGGAAGGAYEIADGGVSLNGTYWYELEEVSRDGSRVIAGPVRLDARAPFALAQNVPNPFNPVTAIRFTIAEDCRATLAVFDASGRRVRSLVDGRLKAAFYRIEWDGRNDEGRPLASGVYFYRLDAGRFSKTRKMVLLR